MNADVIESISKMPVNGNRLELPGEHFANYAAVKSAIMKAGGKYYKNGFDFASEEQAQTVKNRLVGGEAVNDKKKFQFFGTPELLAARLARMAGIGIGHSVLEPQAGRAALVNAALEHGASTVTLVELMPENASFLRNEGFSVIEGDFLKISPRTIGLFDKIIANPPFTKNQDIDHIKHMHSFLKFGGTLVSMASKGWIFGMQKKQVAFREWLESVDAEVTEVDAGEFKESGTKIATVIVKIVN